MLLLAAVAVAATIQTPVTKDGTHQASPLWDSVASAKDCAESNVRAFKAAIAGKGSMNAVDQSPACTDGRLGLLTHGTKVAPDKSDACQGNHDEIAFVHVKVLSGKYAGKDGCVDASTVK